MPQRQVSGAGLELLMSFEGYRQHAAQLADGRWTIGFGHTLSARAGASVSQADAKALLIYDLRAVSAAVEALVTEPLNQNQFDALVCFAFNIGPEAFRYSSVLRMVNDGEMLQAAYALEYWRASDFGGEALVVDGLVRRRAAEKALFLTPPGGWAPAPTALVPPRLDREPGRDGLIGPSVELSAELSGDVARAERIEAQSEPAGLPADVVAIFPPEPEAVAPFPAAAAVELEVLSEPVLPPKAEEPDPAWVRRAVAIEVAREAALAAAEPERAAPATTRAKLGDFDYTVAEPEEGGYWPWVGLGALGLVVFAVSILWALSAKGKATLFSPQVIGVLIALAGMACVVCAVYSLVQRYLGRDDD